MSHGAPLRSTHRVQSHGVELFAEGWGEWGQPPLLLLHGGGQTRHAFRRVAQHLAHAGLFVLVPDLRGHGDSAWCQAGDYALERFADDVRAWSALFSQPPILVGASLGGMSALLAAGEAPQVRARALLLVDIAHRGEPQGVSRIVEFMRAHPDGFDSFEHAVQAVSAYLPHRRADSGGEGLRRNLRERGGRWVWHWDPRILGRTDRPAEEREHFSRRLLLAARAVKGPILIVRGGDSDVLSRDIADEFCREVTGARCVDVPGARHMVAGDQNDPFLDAILRFVRELPSGP